MTSTKGMYLSLLVIIARAARVSPVPPSVASPSQPRRPFSMGGFHQIEAPRLGRPDATPPPPPPSVVASHYQVPEPMVNGFKPILGPRIPIQRRRLPESLDYGTDIITIYDVKPKKEAGDSLLRTVSSSYQVRREEKKDAKKPGRVYDDVIYDLPAEPASRDSKPAESRRSEKHDRLKGWRRIA